MEVTTLMTLLNHVVLLQDASCKLPISTTNFSDELNINCTNAGEFEHFKSVPKSICNTPGS